MSDAVPGHGGYTVADYFDLVRRGVLAEDDRVELLDGVIVAEPPMDPPHATGIALAARAIGRAIGDRATMRVQSPFIASPFSAPEPDVADQWTLPVPKVSPRIRCAVEKQLTLTAYCRVRSLS